MHQEDENAAEEASSDTSNPLLNSDEDAAPLGSSSTPCDSRPTNAYNGASLISKISFIWPGSLLRMGMLRPLEEKDLPSLAQEEESGYNRVMFEEIWRKEIARVESINSRFRQGDSRKRFRPNLGRALIIEFLKSTWIVQPMIFVRAIGKISMSIVLGSLIQGFVEDSKDGYFWAFLFTLSSAVMTLGYPYEVFIFQRKGMQLRCGAVSAIFSKTLRLDIMKNADLTSVGATMNLISNDVERFILATQLSPYIISAPIQIVAVVIMGFYQIGPSFALGVGSMMFFFLPAQLHMGKRFAFLRSKIARFTDERMTLVSQVIEGVRVMKTNGWEDELQSRVDRARIKELDIIQNTNRLRALNDGIHIITTASVTTIILLFEVFVFDSTLIPRDVFTCISLVTILSFEMTNRLPSGMMALLECLVSMNRIQKYLEAPELRLRDHGDISTTNGVDDLLMEHVNAKANIGCVIRLENVTCFWEEVEDSIQNLEIFDRKVPALRDVDLSLKKSELSFIVGAVGSGKSALLYTLANELLPQEGSIYRSYSSLAFVPQLPWIVNGTIKENILMGAPFDQAFYHEVVDMCCLQQDFYNFADGDQTHVGDKGVQCSGGQKARICLARALYRDTDVLLLDDPLSALDVKVGKHIISAIERLAVEKGKCIVVATHQIQFIGRSHCLYEMKQGNLEVVNSNAPHFDFENTMIGSTNQSQTIIPSNSISDLPLGGCKLSDSRSSANEPGSTEPKGSKDSITCNRNLLLEEEQREKSKSGAVCSSTFQKYIESLGGIWTGLFFILSFAIVQGITLVLYDRLGRWSIENDQKSVQNLRAVLGMIFVLAFFAISQAMASFTLTTRASGKMHDHMLSAIIASKIEFFDMNPSGRIMNRFSGDVGSNDQILPWTLHNFFTATMVILGVFVAAVSAIPIVLVTFPPIIWYLLRVRGMFVSTSRELKRFEALSRSQVFTVFNENMSGISTIRSNCFQPYITKQFEEHQNAHSRAYWSYIASTGYLGFRLSFLLCAFNCSACFASLLFSNWLEVDPVILGLGLSLFVELGPVFYFAIRVSAEVIMLMVSVERVLEYGEVEPEATSSYMSEGASSETNGTSKEFPQNGSVEVEELSVRYRDSLPLALDSVSFLVPHGTRLGVVGRSGSGKSTLVQALFRLIEAEHGKIRIGGVDISRIALYQLRRGVTVINQDPILFNGLTMRENLDPSKLFSDEQIIDALIDTQMLSIVNTLPLGMNTQIVDNGKSFSGGERQLLCLARAILQKTKVLVLDEPTSSVDGRTDELFHEAVNRSFKGATIISVAHRLTTVIDNDLILVLGKGKVLEFGTPSDLIALDGHLARMVNDAGISNEEIVKKIR